MNLSDNATRRVVDMTRWFERYGSKLTSLCLPVESTKKTRGLIRNAIVTQTITARSGMKKGKGKVSILCDDGTGTGTDKVIETNVTIWNPWRSQIEVGSGTRVIQFDIVDGLYQVRGADCA